MIGSKGSSDVASYRLSSARGRLLTIADASHIKVLRDSSLSSKLASSRRDGRILRTVRMCRSHEPPIWLAEGTFMLKGK